MSATVDATSHRDLLKRTIDALVARGENAWNVAPPIYRLAWALGATLPPPYFDTTSRAFLLQGIVGGALGALFHFVIPGWSDEAPERLAIRCAVFGIGLGGGLASFYRSKRAKLGLPAWPEWTATLR